MTGLTMEQARLLREWSDGLCVLLDQDDFNNIAKIFKNAVDRQIEYEYQEGKIMKLIDKSKIDFTTIEPYEYASEEMEVAFKEDIEELPEVKVIPLEKLKMAIEAIENLTSWDEGTVEIYDVIEILDKLIESEEKMTKDEAIKYAKEQLEIFGGKHAEFIKLAIELLEQDDNKKLLEIKQINDNKKRRN